ncbi:MAG: DegT/DnrJ/EryC1/StrS family aminotransferase [Candidatus Brocadiaceae bacterium]|nr:DegT/DnrJ/EryC1/StrS family aminotransferase [Candidatus Brocadiaceae bacterium]
MQIPFLDLRIHDNKLRAELLESVDSVLQHGRLMLGPEVNEFEAAVAKAVGTKYAIGVASGCSALYLALKSLDIGPGSEVITTPLTWVGSLNAIAETGARPVCVDIREDFNIDPDTIESGITDATRAIVPVHFTGHVCEMDHIGTIAKKYNLHIVEDAAQAYGARYKSKYAGSFSRAAAFSMNSMKVLGSYGEAGVVTTDDPEINERIRLLRYGGTKSDPKKKITNECLEVSLNHKIDTIQAAMLLVAMKYLPEKMERRTDIASKYIEALSNLVDCPATPNGDIHAYFTFAIQLDRRDELREFLAKKEIETKIFHYPLANEATAYSSYMRIQTPMAKRVLSRFLSIPAHEKLTDEQVNYVIKSIREFFGK